MLLELSWMARIQHPVMALIFSDNALERANRVKIRMNNFIYIYILLLFRIDAPKRKGCKRKITFQNWYCFERCGAYYIKESSKRIKRIEDAGIDYKNISFR